jgi:hypothetical protein
MDDFNLRKNEKYTPQLVLEQINVIHWTAFSLRENKYSLRIHVSVYLMLLCVTLLTILLFHTLSLESARRNHKATSNFCLNIRHYI